VDIAVTFPKEYSTGYIPVVTPMLVKGAIGGAIMAKVNSCSTTGCTIQVRTIDGTNFSVAQTNTLFWSAE